MLTSQLKSIRARIITLPQLAKLKEKMRRARSQVTLEFLKKTKRFLIRWVLFTMIRKNKKGKLRKILEDFNSKNPKSSKTIFKRNKRQLRRFRKSKTHLIAAEGIKDAFYIVLKSHEIIRRRPHSNLAVHIRQIGFKSKKYICFKNKEPFFLISLNSFRSLQSLFINKIQGILVKSLVHKNPIKIVQKIIKNNPSFMEEIQAKPIPVITNEFWEVFRETKRTIKRAEEKKVASLVRERMKKAEEKSLKRTSIRNLSNKRKGTASIGHGTVALPVNPTRTFSDLKLI